MIGQFTEEQQAILSKVEKLMRLAAKNANENEAAAATAKAMELLAAYNLEHVSIDINKDSGKRAEESLVGGFYQFERDLWRAVSELNFVWYFTRLKYIKDEERGTLRIPGFSKKEMLTKKYTHQHVLIGKIVSIAITRATAGSLLQTIERLTKVRIVELNVAPRSSWAVSFRRGIAERVIEKLEQKRSDFLEAEEKQAAKAAKAAREAGSNVETALTLANVKEQEDEGNYDFIHGQGAWAQKRKDELEWRQRRAEARAKAEAEFTAWAKAHPEEAAKQEREENARLRRNANQRRGRWSSGPSFKGDWAAYSMGREVGKNVGISTEVDSSKKGLLR